LKGLLVIYFVFIFLNQASQAQQDAYWKSMRVKIFIALILIIAVVLGVVFIF